MIEVREAGAGDAPAISALAVEVQALHVAAHPAVFKDATAAVFPPATIRARMADPDHLFWVAVVDGATAGYAYAVVQHEAETPWKYAATVLTLDQMGVHAAARGQGVGARLLETVRGAALARGVAEVRLSVWAFNAGARAFYRRHGFSPYQERLWLPLADRAATEHDDAV